MKSKTTDVQKRPLILAVDDDQEMLKLLQRSLELEGYNVITSLNGNLALALLEEHKPDLVILDIMMPELDGFQVLSLIRQRSNVPVIMLTARNGIDSLERAMAGGADDYV